MCIYPSITFYGNCSEAIKFYSEAFGFKCDSLVTFEECGYYSALINSDNKNYVYRAELTLINNCFISKILVCDSITLLFSQNGDSQKNKDNMIFEISGANVSEIKIIYNKLLEANAVINVKLGPRDNYVLYASLIDRFGVCWNICCIEE